MEMFDLSKPLSPDPTLVWREFVRPRGACVARFLPSIDLPLVTWVSTPTTSDAILAAHHAGDWLVTDSTGGALSAVIVLDHERLVRQPAWVPSTVRP